MNYTVHVSFPRSGHHALVRCLMDLLPEELSYCDYYRHCRRVPCTDGSKNYQKTHDFDLDLPIREDLNYIVQIRNPLEAVPSWYEYKFKDPYTRSGERGWKKLLDRWLLRDNRLHWELFSRQKFDYWRRFAKKWSQSVQRPNVILLTYRDFVRDTTGALARVLDLAGVKSEVPSERIAEVVEARRVEKRRELERFRYYDLQRFSRLEQGFMPLLQQLGIDPVAKEMHRREHRDHREF